MHVGLHDHGVEGLVDPAPALQHRGEEAAFAQLGDLETDVTGLGGERPRPAAVAPGRPGHRPLVELGPDRLGGLGVDQRLVEEPDHLPDEVGLGMLIERVEQRGRVKLDLGHRGFLLVSFQGTR